MDIVIFFYRDAECDEFRGTNVCVEDMLFVSRGKTVKKLNR